jgi:hypothetical protein
VPGISNLHHVRIYDALRFPDLSRGQLTVFRGGVEANALTPAPLPLAWERGEDCERCYASTLTTSMVELGLGTAKPFSLSPSM